MINSVCLVGNLAADPEVRSIPNGKKVVKMRMAVNDFWTDRNSGETRKKTHWFSLNAWDRMADTCEKLLYKGVKVAIRGSLEYQEWTTKDDLKRSKIEIRIREMEILTPKDASPRTLSGGDTHSNAENKPVKEYGEYSSDSESSDEFPPVTDDDIPF